jgi:hypothetical protein
LANFLIQGTVASIANGQPVPYATVEVFQVNNPSPGVYNTTMLTTSSTDSAGDFSAPFTHASPPRPNVILRVSQTVGGVTDYIYSENPATDTRWSIADVVNVHLKADGSAVTLNPPPIGQPAGAYFVFTRVGNIVAGSISQTNGYAYPNPPPAPYPYPTMDSDMPFGSTLWIGGWFGIALIALGAQYYKVQWAPGAQTANGPGPWTDVTDPLSNSYYDTVTHNWIAQSMGPSTVGGVSNLYQLPSNPLLIPWAFPDLLATLDTTKIPTGLHTLRVIGYALISGLAQVIGGSIANWAATYVDPFYGTLKLEIDNTPPTLQITGAKRNGVPVAACDTVSIGVGDVLEIDFEAFDTNGHLRNYSVDGIWGHNLRISPPPTSPNPAYDDYSAHIAGTHLWTGSLSLATRYSGSAYNTLEMGSCAYDFRLRVDKRTTNGYGLVYWGYEDNYTIVITRV